jgi:hypothetical protein
VFAARISSCMQSTSWTVRARDPFLIHSRSNGDRVSILVCSPSRQMKGGNDQRAGKRAAAEGGVVPARKPTHHQTAPFRI